MTSLDKKIGATYPLFLGIFVFNNLDFWLKWTTFLKPKILLHIQVAKKLQNFNSLLKFLLQSFKRVIQASAWEGCGVGSWSGQACILKYLINLLINNDEL